MTGEWTVTTVQMTLFSEPHDTPDSKILFGLFEYKVNAETIVYRCLKHTAQSLLFGEEDAHWHPYSKLQQTDDVKNIQRAGEAVWYDKQEDINN